MQMNGKRKALGTLALISLAACATAFSGCSSATYEDDEGNVQTRFDDGGWRANTMNVVTDRETGVQYLIVEGYSNDLAVCPLYNPDGTLCTE